MQPPRQSLDGYKHVVDVEYYPPVSSEGPHFPPEAAKAKAAAQNAPNTENVVEYHEIMEGNLSQYTVYVDIPSALSRGPRGTFGF